MRSIAQAAGVAVETVYSHLPSKRALLDAVVDVSVVGDEQPVAFADRPEFAALGTGPRHDRITAAAQLLTAVQIRTSKFAKVIREAAPSDEQISEVLHVTRQRQRRDIDTAATLIVGRHLSHAEVDELWVLCSPDVYLMFVEEGCWCSDRYESWAAATLSRILPGT